MIAAHLIVGRTEEAFLPPLLISLEGVVDCIVVNDNGEDADGPNARALSASAFARSGNLFVDRAPFVDFAQARNRTLRLHRDLGLGPWAAFVDADEVHRPVARTIARNLMRLPPEIAMVDGYTRHYFASFRMFTSIERRTSFFRVTPDLEWVGRVHERLTGVAGQRLAIPYVYDHYGALFSMHRQAAKEKHYSRLGYTGHRSVYQDESTLREIDYFESHWSRALRYYGDHPPAVAAVKQSLEVLERERYARSEDTVKRFQSPATRTANVARRLNFEYRWRGRMLDPRAMRLMRAPREAD